MFSLHALLDKVILQMPKPRSITPEQCSGMNQCRKDRHKFPPNKSHMQSMQGVSLPLTLSLSPHRAGAVP